MNLKLSGYSTNCGKPSDELEPFGNGPFTSRLLMCPRCMAALNRDACD